mgnify:CR=1 FL=1
MKRYFTYHHSFSTCYEKEPICGVNTQPFFTYANKMKIALLSTFICENIYSYNVEINQNE